MRSNVSVVTADTFILTANPRPSADGITLDVVDSGYPAACVVTYANGISVRIPWGSIEGCKYCTKVEKGDIVTLSSLCIGNALGNSIDMLAGLE